VRGKLSIGAAVILLVCAGAVACSNFSELQTLPERLARVENRIGEVEARQLAMEKKIDELRSASGTRVAGIGADLDTLAAQLRELRGLVDDLKYELGESAGVAENDDTDSRLSSIELRLSAIEDLLGARPALAETPPPSGETPPGDTTTPNDKAFYRKAYALYEAGKYDESRKAFEGFVTKFPSSDLADNALFWIGECYYQQGKWVDAAKSYARVFKEYPKGNKVPDAYYKLGLAFWRLDKMEAAQASLQKVIDEYPKSYVTPLAKRKLELIKND